MQVSARRDSHASSPSYAAAAGDDGRRSGRIFVRCGGSPLSRQDLAMEPTILVVDQASPGFGYKSSPHAEPWRLRIVRGQSMR